MSKIYITLTGTKHYYGSEFLKPGMKLKLEKEPDNEFDKEAIMVKMEGMGKIALLGGNPGVGDVVKQYMYQLAYKKFLADHQIAVVKNYFLMPTEGEEIVNKGKAKLEMLSALRLEDIQIRLIPANLLFDCYLGRKKIAIELLNL